MAWSRDLYATFLTNSDEDAPTLDDVWQPVEQRLPEALAALEQSQGPLEARLWGEVLVPFVAQFFVRGIDFPARFRARWRPLLEEAADTEDDLDELLLSKSNINGARVLELQRLFSPVMRARWSILHTDDDAPFLESNLGYAPYATNGARGCVIPIGRTGAIHLTPRPRTPRVVIGSDEGWLIDIEPRRLDPTEVRRINRRMARFAPDELYGDPRDVVTAHESEMTKRRPKPPEMVWDHPHVLRRNEHELLHFLQLVVSPPNGSALSFEDALRTMNYPAPLYMQVSGERALTESESRALEDVEERAAASEHERLCRLIGADGPLTAIDAPRVRAGETEPSST